MTDSLTFVDLSAQLGKLLTEKNAAYGDSYRRSGAILAALYPNGVVQSQYEDALGVTRIIDKLFRIANGSIGGESPWMDIAGYGVLGWRRALTRATVNELMSFSSDDESNQLSAATPPRTTKKSKKSDAAKKRKLSPEARARIGAAQKKRWAAFRKAKKSAKK